MYVCMYVCMKLAWIKRMIESNLNNWMAIPLHFLRHVGGTLVFECDYDISMGGKYGISRVTFFQCIE